MRADYPSLSNTIQFQPVGDIFVPNLELYINPESLTKSYTQIVTKIQTRGGFVLQHWGEQLTSIEASGKSGTFYVPRTEVTSNGIIQRTAEPFGLANPSIQNTPDRQDTRAWKKFHNFIDFYRKSTLLKMYYDGLVYTGNFSNFSWSEDATNPFFITYSFSFTIMNEAKVVSNG